MVLRLPHAAESVVDVQLLQMEACMASMTTNPDKITAFFALLDKRQRDHEAEKARERKEEQDKKLARLRPWWLESAQ